MVIVDGRELTESYPELKDFFRVMINPVVLQESEQTCEYSEGCLSVPGVYAEVRRPSVIKVEYYDENLEKVVEEFSGFACRMVQHELSHLEGNLFVDNVPPIRRKMLARKLIAISKGSVQTRYKSKR
jgi:peptide deformylase